MPDLIFADSLSRLGTESAFTVLARAQALAAQGRDIINLGIGQPDFPTPAHIVEAGVKALRDGNHGYTPANGLPALREAVAADLEARHGTQVNPDHVVIVPGGKPTMFFAVLMFGQAGEKSCFLIRGFPFMKASSVTVVRPPCLCACKKRTGLPFGPKLFWRRLRRAHA